MQRLKTHYRYYLQVVEKNEKPNWPRPESELIVGSQPLTDGFIQYWAYDKDSGKGAAELPKAESLALEQPTAVPAILIDEDDVNAPQLSLILTKDGHVWAKIESSIDNLADNIRAIVEFAKDKFDFEVEHFMTTAQVSEKVQEKLDDLEKNTDEDESKPRLEDSRIKSQRKIGGEGSIDDQENFLDDSPPAPPLKHPNQAANEYLGNKQTPENNQFPSSGVYISNNSSSKKGWFITLVMILVIIGAAFYFQKQIAAKLGVTLPNFLNKVTPEATPTPKASITPPQNITPTAAADRGKYKVRVLNGTSETGAASKLADSLKDLGWQIHSTGNATNSAFPQTIVRTKSDLTEPGKVLVVDLGKEFSATSSATLPKESPSDLEVIIGKK